MTAAELAPYQELRGRDGVDPTQLVGGDRTVRNEGLVLALGPTHRIHHDAQQQAAPPPAAMTKGPTRSAAAAMRAASLARSATAPKKSMRPQQPSSGRSARALMQASKLVSSGATPKPLLPPPQPPPAEPPSRPTRSATFLLRASALAAKKKPGPGDAKLSLYAISARGVPDCDAGDVGSGNVSDPYVRFTLMSHHGGSQAAAQPSAAGGEGSVGFVIGGDDDDEVVGGGGTTAGADAEEETPWVATSVKLNDLNPDFEGERYLMPLEGYVAGGGGDGGGLEGEGEGGPVVQVEVIDKDDDDADDLIGVGMVRLDASQVGIVEGMVIHGQAGLKDCTVTFSYGIDPTPMTGDELEAMVVTREENLRNRQGGRLRLYAISAQGVPDADADEDDGGGGGSDPYVRFTLLGGKAEDAPWVVTTYMMDDVDPTYLDEEYLLPLPADIGQGPVLQIEMIDKDQGDDNEDDLLGVGAVQLDASLVGFVEGMVLQGMAGLDDCTVSFSYGIEPERPMSDDELHQMVMTREDNLRDRGGGGSGGSAAAVAAVSEQEPPRAGLRLRLHAISAYDLPDADNGIRGSGVSDPYVIFTSMHKTGEGGDEEEAPWVATTFKMNDLNPVYEGEEYLLPLPADLLTDVAGGGAGPTLQIEVVDRDFGAEHDLLCKGTIQLDRSLHGIVSQLPLVGQGPFFNNGIHSRIDFSYGVEPFGMGADDLRVMLELRAYNMAGGYGVDGQLRLHSICAFNVPDADLDINGSGVSDPYVKFTIVDSGADDERDWVVTSHVMNNLNPIFRAQELVTPPCPKRHDPFGQALPWLRITWLVEDSRSLGLPRV